MNPLQRFRVRLDPWDCRWSGDVPSWRQVWAHLRAVWRSRGKANVYFWRLQVESRLRVRIKRFLGMRLSNPTGPEWRIYGALERIARGEPSK